MQYQSIYGILDIQRLMDLARIAELLQPFTGETQLSSSFLEQLQLYLDLLLKWNARINLTAVRDAEEIVTRHFGESVLAATLLFPQGSGSRKITLADIGSGAGFPGLPIKLWAPEIELTLIESQHKKATFLRELVRALKLDHVHVFAGRAEHWDQTADVVTLRAVEQFERALPLAAALAQPTGKMCLLIGSRQMELARELTRSTWTFSAPVPIPLSSGRVIALAEPISKSQ